MSKLPRAQVALPLEGTKRDKDHRGIRPREHASENSKSLSRPRRSPLAMVRESKHRKNSKSLSRPDARRWRWSARASFDGGGRHDFFKQSNSVEFGHPDPRRKRSIPWILLARSIEEGNRTAGITKQTWYRWMKDESFAEQVCSRREAVVAESPDLLKVAVTGAAEGLGKRGWKRPGMVRPMRVAVAYASMALITLQ